MQIGDLTLFDEIAETISVINVEKNDIYLNLTNNTSAV